MDEPEINEWSMLARSICNAIDGICEILCTDIDHIYFEELLPRAIEYGMSPEQFWDCDVRNFYAYEKAYLNKVHGIGHLFGLYNLHAFSVVLSNAFKKENEPTATYLEKPLFPVEKTEKPSRKEAINFWAEVGVIN